MRKNSVYVVLGLIILVGVIYAVSRTSKNTNTNSAGNTNTVVNSEENVNAETATNTNTAANVNSATNTSAATVNTNSAKNTNTAAAKQTYDFLDPKKSSHFVSSAPANGSVVAAAPAEVVITFNADLTSASSVSVMKDGREYSTGGVSGTQILKKAVDAKAADGLYTVNYNACTADGVCSSGYFQFAIDSLRK